MVLCRPHNPTGTLESAADVERFLQRVPPDTIVLLDEAYVEFVAPEHRIDAPALVRRFPNVVVLRTFSKAYGLAGLRIGYGFCAPELAAAVDDAAAVRHGHHRPGRRRGLLRRGSQLQQRIRHDHRGARHLRLRLRAMGVYSTDAHANFVYLPPARPAVARGVRRTPELRVRHYADGGVRITVGDGVHRAVLAAVAQRKARSRWVHAV